MSQMGRVHLYCGDGKGKTTAALGLALRMAGSGGCVGILQFLKDRTSGEFASLQMVPGITILPGPTVKKFVFQMTEREKESLKKEQDKAVQNAFSGDWDLLILDEALGALETDTLSASNFYQLLNQRSPSMEVVLTGRTAPQELLDSADYISEIVKRKHPFDTGALARKGIEF